jgi:hypothetical protein
VLALVFSALLTLYLIVPEGIFRFTFGIYIPARSFTLTRVETAYRAALVSFLPFWMALGLCWGVPVSNRFPFPVRQNSVQQRRADYKLVASALYSEKEFEKYQTAFWPAFTRCARRQSRLCFWYFFLIGLEGLGLGYLASKYAKYQHVITYRWLSDRLLSPYISQWHPLLLTSRLVPNTIVQADILCSNDVLYQGNVSEYFLSEGELSGIIIKQPRRFNRDHYLEAKESGEKLPRKEDYWVPIPSQHLYFFADKIVNLNLSYVTEKASPQAVEKFLAEELPFTQELGKLSVSVEEGPMPLADASKAKLSGNAPTDK